ncbi:pyridoxal-dependent decarboxylase [Rhodoblastus sp.]|jgi:glutamate/tyrosine decarboxylase-like PLP-dependent enzyme|uniref:pyridoxal phosphate-dependent decarboxylase family protein n=1 Tax=Rhodoblastus sp. TaxID=1962975 RepID=UPI0025F062F2|nr:pyridoxal-dependent decarboxylase [Rhodoblastus sp.]
MEKPRDASGQQLDQARAALAWIAAAENRPTLAGPGTRGPEAWFLGTKGENADMFERMVTLAIRDHVFWRRNYHPADPTHITEAIKRSDDYVRALDALQEGLDELLAFLKKSVPFFSMRYQGHMNWDLTIPGMLGYFSAMLYNPNNVAFEGSTATTYLELLVGDDLCRMLGYVIPKDGAGIRPWGHITCDGTVANIEAIWSARNLRFYPLAVKAAITDTASPNLGAAAHFEITRPDGTRARLVDLDAWSMLNLEADVVLNIPARLEREFEIASADLNAAIGRFSLQQLGMAEFSQRFLGGLGAARVFVPGTKHYSHPKAVALLGLGAASLVNIAVDRDARQDLQDLREHLDSCLAGQHPIVAVVAVIGTTEESAVDPLAEILALREEYAKKGLVFHVHADAAWGGYHRSVINEPFDLPHPGVGFVGGPPVGAPISAYTARQLEALARVDSITVDPHKSGYIPYPAGALCYRNGAMRDLVTFSAPVIYHGNAEPTVGIYGVEGSKPGAAAAAVYLSHRVIRPTREGYGKIICQALFSCRKLYARLLSLAGPSDPFVVVPVPRLPAERRGQDQAAIAAERTEILELIDTKTNDEIRSDPAAMALLQEIGPDQNILSYAFNFRGNSELVRANRLNRAIYGRLSIKPGADIYSSDMIVSTTDFAKSAYGQTFMQDLRTRLGLASVEAEGEEVITVLRSVVMDPWVTETSDGSFIDVLARELRKAALDAISELQGSRGY